jgi:glutathione S-transferase
MAQTILYDFRSSICSQMARLALEEKGVDYIRREVDIMIANEQFEPWYVALNPKAVVPTLEINGEIVTDTLRIVNRINELEGPDLSGNDTTQNWLRDIMSLHYGVLMYSNRGENGEIAPQIVARGKYLKELAEMRPDLSTMIDTRLEGNQRFQKLLREPDSIAQHIDATRSLIDQMGSAVSRAEFIAGDNYSLADCFATAALARFTIHNLSELWAGSALETYYASMKARSSFVAAEVIDAGTERDL